MFRENLEKSIILIGPKAVGKSKVASKIQDISNEHLILSTDFLINITSHDINGTLGSMMQFEDFAEDVKKYKQLFDLDDFKDMIYSMAEVAQNKKLTPNERCFAMQFWKTKVLSLMLYKLNTPVVVDASADFGAVVNLTDKEKNTIKSMYYMNSNIIQERSDEVVKRFGKIVYLKPEQGYNSDPENRANDESNLVFLSNPESYQKYATIVLPASELCKQNQNGVFEINENKLTEFAKLITTQNQPDMQ